MTKRNIKSVEALMAYIYQDGTRLALVKEDRSGSAQILNAQYLGGWSQAALRDVIEDFLSTMKLPELKEILPLLESIEERLDSLEELSAWSIPANLRFKRGQRVQFSALADRRLISRRTKGGVHRGTVVKTDGYSVEVHLDGYKKPRSYFHGFFEPIRRKGK